MTAITGFSTATPAVASNLVLSGTAFGGTVGTVTIGGTSCSVVSWTDTSITVTVARGLNKYGTALSTIVSGSSGTSPATAGITGLLPSSGYSYINLGTPNTSAANRLTASPDLAAGDQVEWQTQSGLVTVYSDATFSVDPSVTSFQFDVWAADGSGWGSFATQTINTGTQVTTQSTTLALTTFAPAVGRGLGVSPINYAMISVGGQPVVGQSLQARPSAITLAFTTYAPTITNSVTTVNAQAAVQTLTTYAPTLTQPQSAQADFGLMRFTTFAPTVAQMSGIFPDTAQLVIQTFAPSVYSLTTPPQRQYDIGPAVRTGGIKTARFIFDPHAQLDYQFKWTRWCDANGDHLVTSVFTADPGLKVISDSVFQDAATVFVALDPDAPAPVGSYPQVHCDVTTTSQPPRKDRRSIELMIVNR